MKNIVLMMLLSYLFFPFQSNSKQELTDLLPSATPQTAVDVKSIIFDKEIIDQWCPYGSETNNICPKNKENTIISTVADSDDTDLIYHYKVSGGKIIGQGATVVWDFTNEKTGYYSVTVEIENRQGKRGKNLTKNITVRECPDCDVFEQCDCPVLTVESSRKFVRKNQNVNFKAKIVGGSQTVVTYHWRVIGAKIISGQETSQIKVKPDQPNDNLIIVIVEIAGVCPACINEKAESIKVIR